MAAFTISEAAQSEILGQLRSSSLKRPIVALLDSSQPFLTSPEIVDAITRNASHEEMLALAMKEHREREPTLKMRLDVGLYDVENCPPEYRVEIDGLLFTMAQTMLEQLSDHVLDYDGRAFTLRRGERIFVSLSEWAKGLEKVPPGNDAR